MNNRTVLIVEDSSELANLYAAALNEMAIDARCVATGQELFETLNNDSFLPDLLVLDVKLPDMDGLEILTRLKDRAFPSPVIVMSGKGSINMAVEAMRSGAADFLVKPFTLEKLQQSVDRAFHGAGFILKSDYGKTPIAAQDAQDLNSNSAALKKRDGFGGFIGVSKPMQLVYDIIENAARSDAAVFITGESGTGKEICAEALHRYSRRAAGPFVPINCAAIPKDLIESALFGHVKGAFTGALADHAGAIEQAEGGTLFLDEIAEMAPDMQTKLLRFLQNLSYQKVGSNKASKANVRIICATNKDPLEKVKSGALRQDLFYRLNVIPIFMPPLRDRKNDIIDLAAYFLNMYAREEKKDFREFTPQAEQVLLQYPWPGNVRQLQNTVRGIIVLQTGGTVTADMLLSFLGEKDGPKEMVQTTHFKETIIENVRPLRDIEREVIEKAIARCDGNIPRAAALLEISPSTIYRKNWIGGVFKRLCARDLNFPTIRRLETRIILNLS